MEFGGEFSGVVESRGLRMIERSLSKVQSVMKRNRARELPGEACHPSAKPGLKAKSFHSKACLSFQHFCSISRYSLFLFERAGPISTLVPR